MITPIMPDIIGLPPTTATAKGKSSSPYHGFNMKDKTTDIRVDDTLAYVQGMAMGKKGENI